MATTKDITPEQIRAARALLRLEQEELAERADVSVSTIRRLESPEGAEHVAPLTVNAISGALEEAGVEFIYNGVRLARRPSEEEKAKKLAGMRAAAKAFASHWRQSGGTVLTDDDLYDDLGLPK